MSNLNSLFDVLRGWPDGSALDMNFPVASGTITEGAAVKLESSSPVGTAAATTVLDPATAPPADIDVFVDPNAAADFVTAAITDDHLLDSWFSANADMMTLGAAEHIFVDGYAGAKTLRGVIGAKRLRTTAAGAFTTARTADALSYAVREAILKSEDPASPYLVADADAITTADNGGGLTRVTKAGEFTGAAVGDVGKISGGATAANNGGWMVVATDANNYVDVNLAYAADANSGVAGFQIQVYHPVAYATDATATAATQKLTKAAAFGAVSAGDIAMILDDGAAGNVGTWYVSVAAANELTLAAPAGHAIVNELVGVTNVAVFPAVASRGNASVTVRKRLTRLVDTGATFTESVVSGSVDELVMPWPPSTDPLHWDTLTTRWPVATVVNNTTLDMELDALEEIAPEDFIAGYAANAPYRVDVHDDKARASNLTSADAQHTDGSLNAPDYGWFVTQGNDQTDGSAAGNIACIRCSSGVVLQLPHTSANTLVPGDLLYANAGALVEVTRATHAIGGGAFYSDHKQPVAMVLESNGVAGALGKIVIVTV